MSERAATDGRPGPEHRAGLQCVRVSLHLYAMQDGRVHWAGLVAKQDGTAKKCSLKEREDLKIPLYIPFAKGEP